MDNLKTELINRTAEYELKMIELEREYKQKNQVIDESKMQKFVQRNMKKETADFLKFNINSSKLRDL